MKLIYIAIEVLLVLVVAAMVSVLMAYGWDAYSDSQRPTIEIKKDEWECVRHEQRLSNLPIVAGKAIIMQPIMTAVCVEYRRHAS